MSDFGYTIDLNVITNKSFYLYSSFDNTWHLVNTNVKTEEDLYNEKTKSIILNFKEIPICRIGKQN